MNNETPSDVTTAELSVSTSEIAKIVEPQEHVNVLRIALTQSAHRSEVSLDGKVLRGVRSLHIDAGVGHLTTVFLELVNVRVEGELEVVDDLLKVTRG